MTAAECLAQREWSRRWETVSLAEVVERLMANL